MVAELPLQRLYTLRVELFSVRIRFFRRLNVVLVRLLERPHFRCVLEGR